MSSWSFSTSFLSINCKILCLWPPGLLIFSISKINYRRSLTLSTSFCTLGMAKKIQTDMDNHIKTEKAQEFLRLRWCFALATQLNTTYNCTQVSLLSVFCLYFSYIYLCRVFSLLAKQGNISILFLSFFSFDIYPYMLFHIFICFIILALILFHLKKIFYYSCFDSIFIWLGIIICRKLLIKNMVMTVLFHLVSINETILKIYCNIIIIPY